MDEATVISAELAEALIDAATYKREHKREFPPDWYEWQVRGFTATQRQVMTMAGNQTGKTWSGAYHFALDVTGDYPDDWEGFRFDHSITALAIGVDSEQLEVIQSNLFGPVEEKRFTGGWIHPDEVLSIKWVQGSRDIASKVTVRSKYGMSTIHFRSYTQVLTGQQTLSFAGRVIDLIWPDEQPPDSLVGQLNVRLLNGNMGKGGRMRYTMTPELGVTELVEKFMNHPGEQQHLIGPVAWEECEHMTPEAQAAALDGIPVHEHDMRRKGIPFFGSGLIYPYPEERLVIERHQIPDYYLVLKAVDLGVSPDPTAIAFLVYDPETDTTYLVSEYREAGASVPDHAAAMNAMWPEAPVVFPHDVKKGESNVEHKAGATIERAYNDAGVLNTVMFENPGGGIKVEPGVLALNEAMRSGKFRVFEGCDQYLQEKRLYHRKNGKIVKGNDHLQDAVRYGHQMIKTYGIPLASAITTYRPQLRSKASRPLTRSTHGR